LAPAPTAPSTDFPTGLSLAQLIRFRSERQGDSPFVVHAREPRGITFGQLDHGVARWSAVLDEAGIAVGTTIGLVVEDPIAFSEAFLAIIASGRWAAPLDPGLPSYGTAGMGTALARVGADVVISNRPEPDGMAARWIDLSSMVSASPDDGTAPPLAPFQSDGTGGAVLATSGTTGTPKVIRLHQAQLLHTAASVAGHHELTPDDRCFNSLPMFHINAEVVGLLATLTAGSSLVLDDRFHRTDFWSLMAHHGITWVNAVPAIVSRLATPRSDEVIPPGIRFTRSASAPLPAQTLSQYEATTGIPVVETYGMSEAASQITANPLRGVRKPGSVGLPVGVEVRIVADDGDPDCGQVEIRGASVITAYGGNDHADRFDADGWLRTGDLGHFDADGYLYLQSRTDDVINRGGEKVFPREIEEIILVDDDVAAVSIVGAPDPELNQVPVAFVVLTGDNEADVVSRAPDVVARIIRFVDTALVRSKRPVRYSIVGELPANATGKVQRRVLRQGEVSVLYEFDCR
jgi:acyl-CoA synthetase (AMP-forming)/AMP-acid ligase II